MYIFAKTLKCSCGSNYRGINERGKKKYVCSGYANYRTCNRYIVPQDKLIYLIHKHLEIRLIQSGKGIGPIKKKNSMPSTDLTLEEISQAVEVINIDPNAKTIEILYKDNTRSFVSDSAIYY